MLNKKMTSKSLIAEMDQRVKQMLKLIEEDGDSFAKKAEMYYQKRPELIRLVEDFYRRYRSLAERYDNVTGELRKTNPPDLQSQCSGISDFGSEPPSVMPSPDRKPNVMPSPDRKPNNRRRSGHRAPGFEFFLGADSPNRDGYESPTMDSESESDDFFGKFEERGLRRRIMDLEAELRDVKEQLQLKEGGNCGGYGAKYEEEINYLKMELERYKSGDADDVLSGSVDDPVVLDSIEVDNKNESIQELKEKFDALQVKYDGLNTKISELVQDASFKDDQIDQMSNHMNQMHMEHVALIEAAEGARKMAEELRLRIKELEREVEKKEEIIVSGAEEKREAIRQLCFSLEHYRNGYHRLREVVTGQKPPVEATQIVI